MTTTYFELFKNAQDDQSQDQCKIKLEQTGYSAFFQFIEDFKDYIKRYDDHQIGEIEELLIRARKLFPEPSQYSPAWAHIWDEYTAMTGHKNRVLSQIPASDREGEWQIVMDNPYTNQQVACYPSLSFLEAAYLFGYFRPTLENNEYIRMQKVTHAVVEFGSEQNP